jgi:two-component system, chemotaxis family, CheB/CheR fusion protein
MAIESVQLAATVKGIQIGANLTPVTILGDTDRLGQVLWNLLTNAIKFTPTGGRVDVTLTAVGTYAEICVSDTGQGIGAELLPHIFDRFRQGDSSSSKSTQGLGIGTIYRQTIVELHGGTVGAESGGAGLGTTILVRLPLAAVANDLALAATTKLSNGISIATPAEISLTGLRILVVDDEADILELMKYILENVGAQVTIVSSTQAAISALVAAEGKYDALLSDIGMPTEDGLTLIRQVRTLAVASGGQIPAVAVTAYVSDTDKQLALAAGFQVHLAKPVDPTQLIQLVATLTGRMGLKSDL